MSLLPKWSVHSFERLQNNQHRALSWHSTWLGARWASRGDDDLVVFGPYWPGWQERAVCRVFGHRPYRSTAVWVRDLDAPPTRWDCSRCSAELRRDWRTFGQIVKYGTEGVTYDGDWHGRTVVSTKAAG